MILVTGASGFVGNAVVSRLVADGLASQVVVAVRRKEMMWPSDVHSIKIGDMLDSTDWSMALKDVNTVVHCAARVHVMQEKSIDPLASYRQVNVDGTINLARQAACAGVRRFIFVSSIKVNGEVSKPTYPISADDYPAPVDPYGISKWEAELGLQKLAETSGMEIVVVRPPLVYGPGVKANFETMMQWIARGVPLPLGRINNARSLVALDNLVDLLVTCITHPAAAGETFMVSDGEDVSTSELLRRTAIAMNRKILLVPVPVSLLKLGLLIMGKRTIAQRLCDTLQVDIEKTKNLLNWRPPLKLDDGLMKAVKSISQ